MSAEGRAIVVFNLDGEFFALGNRCPHRGGSLCDGIVTGLVLSDEPGRSLVLYSRSVLAPFAPVGIFLCYVPTIVQSQQIAEALQRERQWALVETFETLYRPWNIEGQSVRPFHRMVAHTGFITVARRVVPEEGAAPPARLRPLEPED